MSTQSTPYRPDRLPDRYVREVVRRLPEEQRADISAELGASLADRVESMRRSRAGLSLEAAERDALVELGDPVRLAAEYSGRRLQLIGPELYPAYTRVLRSATWTAIPTAVGVFSLFSIFSSGSGDGDEYVGALAWLLVTVVVQVAFWVTAVFAAAERLSAQPGSGVSVAGCWSPDDLPEVASGARGSVVDLGTHLVWLAVLAVAIVWQQVASPIGDGLPLLDPGLWSSWLPFLLVLILGEAAFEVWRYRSVGWTRRLALVNIALSAVSTATVVYLCATDRLFNPEAVMLSDGSTGTASIVIAITAVGLGVWDSVDGWRKARSA